MALPFRTDTRDSCVAVGCRHGCATRRFAVPTPYTHSKLDNTSVSLSRSGGTLRTLHTPLNPRALALCGRQSSLVEAVHSVAVAMAKRCATGMARICSREWRALSIAMPTLVSRACGGRCHALRLKAEQWHGRRYDV